MSRRSANVWRAMTISDWRSTRFSGLGSPTASLPPAPPRSMRQRGMGIWKVMPPRVKTVNATGSGDSMVAGLLFGLTHGWDFERCLRFGAAAGAANASVWEVATSSREQIEALEGRVEIVHWR